MLIKDEDTANIVLGDTLGDGFEGRRFHYLMANPPFGVEWKDQKAVVEREHRTLGFSGRFGAGLPAINDGSLLFLQHMTVINTRKQTGACPGEFRSVYSGAGTIVTQ